jgi:hypothetical protein
MKRPLMILAAVTLFIREPQYASATFITNIATQACGTPLYGATFASEMLILDQNTGAVSSIVGNMGNGILGLKISGSGKFFGFNKTDLYSINPANANATHIGAFGIATGTNYDAAFNGDQMFLAQTNAVDSTANLYTVNTNTGEASLVGNVGYQIYGLNFSYGTDYVFMNGGPYFGIMDLTTGDFTSLPGAFTPPLPSGGKSLYGFTPSGQIISINTTTGLGTFVAQQNGPPGSVVFTAASACVPEPSTFLTALFGVGMGLLVSKSCRRKATLADKATGDRALRRTPFAVTLLTNSHGASDSQLNHRKALLSMNRI